MKKSDLQSGMILETRDGNKGLLVKNTSNGDIFIDVNGWNKLEYYNDDLTNNEFRDLDIMKVYHGKFGGLTYMLEASPLIWERKEKPVPVVTEAERAILESLDKHWKYIARDDTGDLFIYDAKPNKAYDVWRNGFNDNMQDFQFFNHIFQFIKFEDDEPYKIEDLI